jgi:hypothetical protein
VRIAAAASLSDLDDRLRLRRNRSLYSRLHRRLLQLALELVGALASCGYAFMFAEALRRL